MIISKDDAEEKLSSLGQNAVFAMLRPLHQGPTVNIGYEEKIDMTDLDIDQEVKNALKLRKNSFQVENFNSLVTSIT